MGLLCVACVPGGGIAHVIVSVMITDRTLSIAMNAAGFVTAIGKHVDSSAVSCDRDIVTTVVCAKILMKIYS